MTTGLTTGPFALDLGETFATPDPNANSNSGSVDAQFQNASEYALTIQGGTDQWTVTSYQSTTIPCPTGGLGFLVTPTGITGTPGNGQLTVVWLLDNQEAPQPDGPLQSPTGTVVAGLGIKSGPLAPTAQVSFDVTIPLFTTDFVIIGTLLGVGIGATLTATGDTTSTVYLDQVYAGDSDVNASLGISGATETGVTVELMNTGPSTLTYSLSFAALGTGGTQILTFPGIPLDVVPYGGLSSANNGANTDLSTPVQILAAPAAGTCYRVHSFNIEGGGTQTCGLMRGASGLFFASGTGPADTVVLGGRLINVAIYAKASGSTATSVEVGYDIVTLPSIA